MAFYDVGQYIKAHRKLRGLTQAELADGICDMMTISRIERGAQGINRIQMERIMQKLGISSNKLFDLFLSSDDFGSLTKKTKLEDCLREGDYYHAKKIINELEKNQKFVDSFDYQFLLGAKAEIMMVEDGNVNKAVEYCYTALRITIPSFEVNNIHMYLLTFEEIILVNMIACAYGEKGDLDRAIKILSDLKASIDKTYVDESEKARTHPMVVSNLAKYLNLNGDFNDVIALCEEGTVMCIQHNKLELLPELTYNGAYANFHIGNKAPCEELFTQAYYALRISRRLVLAEKLKNDVKRDFDISIR